MGVSADTKLIRDFADCLKEKYERDTLAIEFPKVIDQLKGTDANIEIIKSSELQILKLAVKPPVAI